MRPPRSSWLRGEKALLALAVLAMTLGCKSERESPHVTSPVGDWNDAFSTVEYHPSFYKNGKKHAPSVLHSLTIRRKSDQNRSYVILAQQSEDWASPALFQKLRDTEYTLKFAPDGGALAASIDGGKAWTLFDLFSLASPVDDPFWCRHRTFASLDPWPSMRSVAIEVLAAVDPASPAFQVHRGPEADEWPGSDRDKPRRGWDDEILGASRYACARKGDPELRSALVAAFLHDDFGYSRSEIGDCVGDIALANPAEKDRLQASLATANKRKTAIQSVLEYTETKTARKTPPKAP